MSQGSSIVPAVAGVSAVALVISLAQEFLHAEGMVKKIKYSSVRKKSQLQYKIIVLFGKNK